MKRAALIIDLDGDKASHALPRSDHLYGVASPPQPIDHIGGETGLQHQGGGPVGGTGAYAISGL